MNLNDLKINSFSKAIGKHSLKKKNHKVTYKITKSTQENTTTEFK